MGRQRGAYPAFGTGNVARIKLDVASAAICCPRRSEA